MPHDGFQSDFSGTLPDAVAAFLESVASSKPVDGYTHNFYRYPARFSPEFARHAISVFTRPGDTVCDPFMGGGTSAVEALVAGRRFIGCDINQLSMFLGQVKTSPLMRRDREAVAAWEVQLQKQVNLHRSDHIRHNAWERYQRNLPWWIRKTLEIGIESTEKLPHQRQRNFARCTLLRAAQISLDCRSELPTTRRFLELHGTVVSEMLEGIRDFSSAVKDAFSTPPSHIWRHRRFLCRSAEGMESDNRIPASWLPPKLVITSPPYIGIHVLYHRWQIQGRRESPAPYWIAACEDGKGEVHYTLAGRRRKDTSIYMNAAKRCFASIARHIGPETLVVQLVAFANPAEQLPLYLEAMEQAGLKEEAGLLPERLWREVPGRRWYARHRDGLSSSKEVLLIHKQVT